MLRRKQGALREICERVECERVDMRVTSKAAMAFFCSKPLPARRDRCNRGLKSTASSVVRIRFGRTRLKIAQSQSRRLRAER